MLVLSQLNNVICSSEDENLKYEGLVAEIKESTVRFVEKYRGIFDIIRPSNFDEEFYSKAEEKNMDNIITYIAFNYCKCAKLSSGLFNSLFREFKRAYMRNDQEKMELLTSFLIDVIVKSYKETHEIMKDLTDIEEWQAMYEPEEWETKKVELLKLIPSDFNKAIKILPNADQVRNFLEEVADYIFESNNAEKRIRRTKNETRRTFPKLHEKFEECFEEFIFYRKYLFKMFRKSTLRYFLEAFEEFENTFSMNVVRKTIGEIFDKIIVTNAKISRELARSDIQVDNATVIEIARKHFPILFFFRGF